MKISGAYTLNVPQERAYALLRDPAILAKGSTASRRTNTPCG
jgi:hypothetical protein